MVLWGMTTLAMTHYLTPWKAEGVGHGKELSLWRWFDGFRTPHTVIITDGVANAAPGYAVIPGDAIADADSSTSDTEYEGKAVWSSKRAPHTVTAAEGTILTTAGYVVS